jgi:predicted MPP superfamily phosphohydrolase
MTFLIFILLFLLLEWYIFRGLNVLISKYQPVVRRGISIFYWLISLGFVIYLLFVRIKGESVLQNSPLVFVQSTFLIYFLSKLILAFILLIDDLRRLVMSGIYSLKAGKKKAGGRSRFLTQLGLILAALPFSTLLYGSVRNTYRYTIFRKKVPIKGLPDSLEGLKIVQISDIHAGSFFSSSPLVRAVQLINNEEPDLVLFTGDLVNDKSEEMDMFLKVLDKIKAKHGVFSVFGNHDYGYHTDWPTPAAKAANLERLKSVHQQLGWKLLLNENRLLTIGQATLAVIGVENYSVYERFPSFGELAKAYQGAEEASVKLLLSHDPSHWEAEVTKDFQDIDLTFSGHTHGFQFGVEIPGWVKWSPVKYMYKQWAGLYEKQQQYLYVNRGLGYIGYAGRVGILPEITVIELSKK